ncbi:MAG: class I SAM-dependent methyltransferase [Deltaproteobacteria bacterium]|nr:class I SAM-dependent methyltransferase [Deltaproteobacteria bacterium]
MKAMAGLLEHGLVPLILTAERSGLLAELDRAPGTAQELAARGGLHPRATAMVLDALYAVGVCSRTEAGVFERPSGAERTFPWARLPRFLATGEVDPQIDGGARGEGYARVVSMLAQRFEPWAAALAARLAAVDCILDVGAGSGVWSLAMATRSPGARVTALELPEVLPRFFERAATLGLRDRVDGIAASYFEARPEGRFDRVVLANVLHLETPADARALVARAASWLSPEGELVVIDCVGEGEAHEPSRSLYALHLAMRTARGAVHAPRDLLAWAREAGLGDGRLVPLRDTGPGLGALVCRR